MVERLSGQWRAEEPEYASDEGSFVIWAVWDGHVGLAEGGPDSEDDDIFMQQLWDAMRGGELWLAFSSDADLPDEVVHG